MKYSPCGECEIIPLRKLCNIASFVAMWNEICPHSRQRIFHICGANISQQSYFTCPQGKFRWKKHTLSGRQMCAFFWRRWRDLNSRADCSTYTLSRGASSPLEYISKAGGELLAIILYQALGRLSRLFLKKLTRFTKNSRHLSRILQKLILCWRFTYCKSSFLLLLPRAFDTAACPQKSPWNSRAFLLFTSYLTTS